MSLKLLRLRIWDQCRQKVLVHFRHWIQMPAGWAPALPATWVLRWDYDKSWSCNYTVFQQAFKNSEQELRSTSWEPQAGGLTGMWESLSIPNWMNFWGFYCLCSFTLRLCLTVKLYQLDGIYYVIWHLELLGAHQLRKKHPAVWSMVS